MSQLGHERMRASLLNSFSIFCVSEGVSYWSTFRSHAPSCGALVPCPLWPAHVPFHFLIMAMPFDPYCPLLPYLPSSISLRMAVGLEH